MADVRQCSGVPTVAMFADMGAPFPGGTPVVVDSTTGRCYVLIAGVVTEIAPSMTPSGATILLLNAAQGDLIYGSATDVWSTLAKNTSSTRYLSNTGTSNNPAWAQVALSTGVSDYTGPTSWTPELWDASLSGNEGQTYSSQVGTGIKIGRLAFVSANMTLTSLGTLNTAQQARLGNLPWTASTGAPGGLVGQFGANLNLTAAGAVTANVSASGVDAPMRVWTATTGPANVTVAEISADGQIYLSGVYETAS